MLLLRTREASKRLSLVYTFRPGKNTFNNKVFDYYVYYCYFMETSLFCALCALPEGIIVSVPTYHTGDIRYINMMRYMIRAGADIHYDNESALRFAVLNRNVSATELLLQSGANPNCMALLEHAVVFNYIDIIVVLLEYNAHVTNNVIDAATRGKNYGLLYTLITKGNHQAT